MCIEVSRARILRIRINVGGCARGADELVKKGYGRESVRARRNGDEMA